MESLEIGLLSQYAAAPLLLPANEVCEGYVFTSVCLSTGGVCPIAFWDTPPRKTPGQAPPRAGTPLGRIPPGRHTSHPAQCMLGYG